MMRAIFCPSSGA